MISVIIPAYNAENTISICLEALFYQTIDQTEYEVIVIDDGSTDTTKKIIQQNYPQVRLISQHNQGPAAARNNGAHQAKGDLLFFTDSDCEPTQNWIEEMRKPFTQDPNLTGVKGIYKTKQPEIVARFVQLEYEDKYHFMRKQKSIDFIDTYSAGFRKETFLKMNGYNEDFPVACAEDVELSFRMANAGYKMIFVPDAIVYHLHPHTLRAYLKKKYKFARWRMLAVKHNPNKIVKDSHTPYTMKFQAAYLPVLFIGILISLCLRSWLAVLILLFIYFITTIPFTLRAIKKDPQTGILCPLLLFLRSTAQLPGIIYGLLRPQ